MEQKRAFGQRKRQKGNIRAPKVILAISGHIENFGHFRRRRLHIFTYASMSRALNTDECARLGGQTDWGLTPWDPLGSTVRRISRLDGDRNYVRNRFTYEPAMMPSAGTQKSFYNAHK